MNSSDICGGYPVATIPWFPNGRVSFTCLASHKKNGRDKVLPLRAKHATWRQAFPLVASHIVSSRNEGCDFFFGHKCEHEVLRALELSVDVRKWASLTPPTRLREAPSSSLGPGSTAVSSRFQDESKSAMCAIISRDRRCPDWKSLHVIQYDHSHWLLTRRGGNTNPFRAHIRNRLADL